MPDPKSKSKPDPTETSVSALTSAMLAANPMTATAWGEIMTESGRFIADRLQKDREAQKALLACKTPAELMEVQSAFFAEAVEQYTAQATSMFEKMTEATEDTLKKAAKGWARGYDDVPL